MRYVEKYNTAGQATDDNIIQCMRITYWIPKTTNKHSEYVTHSFSTATIIARTHRSVALYVH